MEIRNLRTFQQVAEKNSFTAAANALGYSQSTVSFQIKQLEQELDCLLFERINHTITLTDQGRELLDYAHTVLRLTDEFTQGMKEIGTPQGFVHIVAPDSLCEAMMLSNYAEFYQKYPKISLKFSTADTVDMFRMLDRNEADIILTLDRHVYSQEYVIEVEQRVQMHFVTAADSPLVGRTLSIRDLLEEPFVLTEQGMGYRRVLDEALAKMSLQIHPILEIGRTDIITEVLASGRSISFLPDFVVKKEIESGKLAILQVEDLHADVWKQLIYHRNKWISHSLRSLIDYIKQTEFSPENS